MEEGAADDPASRLVTDRYSIENRAAIFKELSDNFAKFFALLVAVVAMLKTDKGESFFQEKQTVIGAIMAMTVLYFFGSITGAVLQLYIRNSLPILGLFVLGSVISILTLSLISHVVSLITIVFCGIAFVMIVYYHYQELLVPERIKQWIENIKQWILSTPERVKNWIEDIKQWILSASERIKHWIENVKQCILSVPERIKHWIENIKQSVPERIKRCKSENAVMPI